MGLKQNKGSCESIKLSMTPRNIMLPCWGPKPEPKPEHMFQSLNTAHIHFTLNLTAHHFSKVYFYFLRYGLWMIFKVP